MTERLGALTALAESHSALADTALQRMHALYHSDALVLDKWFALQAAMPERDGAGVEFWADRALELDAINPQGEARLARARSLGAARRAMRCAAPVPVETSGSASHMSVALDPLGGRRIRPMPRWGPPTPR